MKLKSSGVHTITVTGSSLTHTHTGDGMYISTGSVLRAEVLKTSCTSTESMIMLHTLREISIDSAWIDIF